MPDSWRGEPLGSQAEVRAKITDCIAGVDWSDPAWGVFHGDGYSYEFNTGTDEPCDSVMVHVRGGGSAVAPLLELGRRCDWNLLDTSQGEWMHHCNSAEAGWEGFKHSETGPFSRSTATLLRPQRGRGGDSGSAA